MAPMKAWSAGGSRQPREEGVQHDRGGNQPEDGLPAPAAGPTPASSSSSSSPPRLAPPTLPTSALQKS